MSWLIRIGSHFSCHPSLRFLPYRHTVTAATTTVVANAAVAVAAVSATVSATVRQNREPIDYGIYQKAGTKKAAYNELPI